MKRIIYQAFTRLWGRGRFADWDYCSLEYLRSLGADYIWYTGIPRHASALDFVKGDPGCPYSVEDWKDTNPYFCEEGEDALAEFGSLVARSHEAGLKVLIDYIPNHVARSYRGEIKHFDYCDGDWTDTLKNDWSSPQTFWAMLDILRFWASRGVDGFRCDMVELVDAEKLGSLISALKSEFPDLLFVAELYGRHNYSRYLEAGFDLLYDKCGLYDSLVGIGKGERSAREITWNWQFLGAMQPRMLNFLENHDEIRRAAPSMAALAVSALFNTASFMLYFGQETGEDAAESSDGKTSIFSWCRPSKIRALYDYIHGAAALGVEDAELLERFRSCLATAKLHAFASGEVWDLCYCNAGDSGLDSGLGAGAGLDSGFAGGSDSTRSFDPSLISSFDPERHFAFLRYDSSSCYLVVCNFSIAGCSLSINIPAEAIYSVQSKAQASSLPSRVLVQVPAGDYSIVSLI